VDKNFRNPLEGNAEYILIPGGTIKYSVTKKTEKVPDLYFTKYPVTNKQYRRFIDYLSAGESQEDIPFEQFAHSLLAFAKKTEGFVKYLGTDPKKWAGTLRSRLDGDKRFNGDEHPVVGVTWFAAQAYCLWLSEIQRAKSKEQKENMEFRLPAEEEWEWAASGGTREYPWGKDTPDETLANFGEKVGHTTPVGAYPAGATPEGLMDMAGNVWEWMENRYQEDEAWRALRGGSWLDTPVYLRCAARDDWDPDHGWSDYVGFRVVRAQSFF